MFNTLVQVTEVLHEENVAMLDDMSNLQEIHLDKIQSKKGLRNSVHIKFWLKS